MGPLLFKQTVKAVLPRGLHPRAIAERKVARTAQGRVLSGPFRGMRALTSSEDFVDYRMLLGTYELELHPVIAEIQRKGFHTLIDVGSAQGYYAVGFAMVCRQMRVIAFESNPEACEQMTRMAVANGVADRITQLGRCGHSQLAESLTDPTGSILLVDIDGGEAELIDPGSVPALRFTTILLEEHECFVPGIIELIESRFCTTHQIQRVNQQTRRLEDLCVRSWLWDRWLLQVLPERPPGNSWIYLSPYATTEKVATAAPWSGHAPCIVARRDK